MRTISPVQYNPMIREGSTKAIRSLLKLEWFVGKVGFEPGVKEQWLQSGDDDEDGLTSEGDESRQDWSGEADGMNLEVDSRDEVMMIVFCLYSM